MTAKLDALFAHLKRPPYIDLIFYCGFAATTYIDFASGDGRKALRRCPDLSRKRDGIVTRALSFLLYTPFAQDLFATPLSMPIVRKDRRIEALVWCR